MIDYQTIFPNKLMDAPDLKQNKPQWWHDLLYVYPSQIDVMKISKLNDFAGKKENKCFNPEKADDMILLKKLLDAAETIFVYDEERCFSLLRRIWDDDSLVDPESISPVSTNLRYPRQSSNYFAETDMILWRYKCADIKTHFPNKKSNQNFTVRQLLEAHRVPIGSGSDDLAVLHRALIATYIDNIGWKDL
jgi:hypothetical protein